MPQMPQTRDIWTGPTSNRVGTKVGVTSGTAKVQSVTGGATSPLGQVPAGNSIVWEGEYEKLQVVAMAANTVGTYENRAPVGGQDPDRLVGEGSITLASGGTMTPYASQSAVNRMILVTAGTYPVTLRLSPTGADILTIDAGDSAFCSHNNVTSYCIAGNGTVNYKVYDVAPTCGPYPGSTSGKNGDLDSMLADGSKGLTVTVTNAGPGTLSVVTQVQGGEATTTMVPPSGQKSVSGAILRFDWTVQDADPNRTTTANFTVTGQ